MMGRSPSGTRERCFAFPCPLFGVSMLWCRQSAKGFLRCRLVLWHLWVVWKGERVVFLPFLSLSSDKQPSYTSWFDADSGRSISLLRIFSSLLLAYPEMQESSGPPWCRPPWGWQERDAVSTPRSLLSDEGFLDFVRSRLPFILLWRMVFII